MPDPQPDTREVARMATDWLAKARGILPRRTCRCEVPQISGPPIPCIDHEAIASGLRRAYAEGVQAGREEAAKAIRHTYHAAGCEFHTYSLTIGKECPNESHVIPCSHCADQAAAIRAGATP